MFYYSVTAIIQPDDPPTPERPEPEAKTFTVVARSLTGACEGLYNEHRDCEILSVIMVGTVDILYAY